MSRSGFYAWCAREESEHARRDRQLTAKIRVLHADSKGTYGSPRIHCELIAQGECVGRNRVARLMRDEDIVGRRKRRFRKTTDSGHDQPVAPNLVDRAFEVDDVNEVWAEDITYVRTWEGWLYLAVLIDLNSRRVVGWAAANHMCTELVLEALRMATVRRRPPRGLVHHSDRGSQYASHVYQEALASYGMTTSMSRRGNCWDNAVVESFFSTLKEELIYRAAWPTVRRAREAIAEYIDNFYNTRRRHSTLGYVSPVEYEHRGRQEAVAA